MLQHMKTDNSYTALVAGIAIAVFLLLVSGPGRSEPTEKVNQTIQYLISAVSGADLTFIRNGNSYTPKEAAEHINRKYEHFRDDIETPEEFIELCASKSLLSGKPYMVVDGEGKERRTSDWLRAELAAYRARSR